MTVSQPRARSGRRRLGSSRPSPGIVGLLGLVVLSSAVLSWGPAGPAEAAAPGRLVRVVVADRWRAGMDATSGTNAETIAVTTPAACPSRATRHTTQILAVIPANSGDRAEARRWLDWPYLYSPSDVGIRAALVDYPMAGSWQQLANSHGLRLVPGRYEFATRCYDDFVATVFAEWRGSVTFTTPTSFRVDSAVSPAGGKQGVAPKPPAGGTTAAAPTPGPVPSVRPPTPAPNPSAAQPVSPPAGGETVAPEPPQGEAVVASPTASTGRSSSSTGPLLAASLLCLCAALLFGIRGRRAARARGSGDDDH